MKGEARKKRRKDERKEWLLKNRLKVIGKLKKVSKRSISEVYENKLAYTMSPKKFGSAKQKILSEAL